MADHDTTKTNQHSSSSDRFGGYPAGKPASAFKPIPKTVPRKVKTQPTPAPSRSS